ncbi:FAD-dependent oxidoreductase (4Fe-4S ferredoxin cluster binding protein) [Desulfamplus magnetovallimortis]|uniref:Ion-translocating oxidoreductase complex subunit B n=1 Tax=Desulfamplus magnetovallimortis TaxID=1246637 RepID=A0A1W1H9B0_9BACT|nr:RnfABCDGE type electron transport complex subunit B [Desulfamplus magnetovallimortis]SLM29029.1 FAD-dependent oxidoreductase (4Fe-4S ferredoxin cluster binding protein) [Desulfamplus magnetovallimortis]
MIQSVIMMGGLGLVIGGALAFASKIFYVYVDPLVAAIDDVLPGANCGGCGYPGCTPNAEAIASGKSSPDSCVAAGPDVAIAIAALMGVSIGEKEPEIARSGCYYGTKDADVKYLYDGINDCRAAAMVFGGMKECNIGCLGMGTCVAACPFGALEMGEHGLPVVDVEKCTACGTCEKICPKNIIRITSVSMRIMKEYTEDKCITPCQRACPTGIDIREYLARIRQGDNGGAVQVIKERNPFPTVIGRICPAPCESECRRQLVDESVAINNLKRFVCDIEMDLGKRVQPYKAPATGRKVAVIGGGVEGLSAAFFTARLGHEPTVFEATSILGGLLRIAIADERLPMDVLDWDIEGILEMGVNVKTGMKAGENFTIPSLLAKGYEAVFTATGGWDSRLSRGEISEITTVFPGGYLMIDLLRADIQKSQRIPCGRNVVIVGGGSMASEAVKVCREQGAENITVLSRKTAELSNFDSDSVDSMTGNGATIIYSAGLTKVIGQDEKLCQIECTDLATGNKTLIDAQTVILSAGRFPELVFIRTNLNEQEGEENEAVKVQEISDNSSTSSTDNGTAFADKDELSDQGASSDKKQQPIFWEGYEIYKAPSNKAELGFLSPEDELSGYSAAVVAINGGRRAAATIHKLMYGLPVNDVKRPVTKRSILQGVTSVENVQIMPRNFMPLNESGALKAGKNGKVAELYNGYTPEKAQNEAERCLKCGLLCYERTLIQEEVDEVNEKSASEKNTPEKSTPEKSAA